jgi:hypothetical protein
MGNSTPTNIIIASVLILLASIKIKEKCYYCFLALFSLGLIFFIFGLFKFWKQRNG